MHFPPGSPCVKGPPCLPLPGKTRSRKEVKKSGRNTGKDGAGVLRSQPGGEGDHGEVTSAGCSSGRSTVVTVCACHWQR